MVRQRVEMGNLQCEHFPCRLRSELALAELRNGELRNAAGKAVSTASPTLSFLDASAQTLQCFAEDCCRA